MAEAPAADLRLAAGVRRLLIESARAAVTRVVESGAPAEALDAPAEMRERRGVFVTLRRAGELRGCIGYPYPTHALGRAVVECAVAAAVNDPRFPPVEPGEIEGLSIELSVLSVPAPCRPEDVVAGEHGVILSQGRQRGLLLPQVATEQGWDRITFLGHACLKAGLPPDAWQQGATIERFIAEVFGEEERQRRPSPAGATSRDHR